MSPELKSRLFAGTGALSFFALLLVFHEHVLAEIVFFALVLTCNILLHKELYALVRSENMAYPERIARLYGTAYLVVAAFFPLLQAGIFFLFVIDVFARAIFTPKDSLDQVSVPIFAFVYVVLPLSLVFHMDLVHMAYVVFATSVCDSSSYFIGKKFGKKPLSHLSPKKTQEGFFGGIVSTLFFTMLYYYLLGGSSVTVYQSMYIGVTLGCLAQFGDIVESMLKRQAKVKDSSSYLPGLGGVLDTLDSALVSIPFVYIYFNLVAA